MPLYNLNGARISTPYAVSGSVSSSAFDVIGSKVYPDAVDYSNYSYTRKWASKGIGSTQGFDILDGRVFWVSKSGDSTIPSNCYVWNLSDGSQALSTPYITIYSGHGNNLSFDFPTLYASPAYPPSRVFVNAIDNQFNATLTKTLVFNDGSTDCDACIDEIDKTILWTLGHTGNHTQTTAPFYISKWDLTSLTDNGDGTFTPLLLQRVSMPQPASYYFQGCKVHDGLLWFASGYSGTSTNAYVYAIDPDTGERIYTIDCRTTEEPEGLAWVEDDSVAGGYALYVGFAGMMLRKYTFGARQMEANL